VEKGRAVLQGVAIENKGDGTQVGRRPEEAAAVEWLTIVLLSPFVARQTTQELQP